MLEEPARGPELGDQPVLDVEQPRHPAEGDLGAVAKNGGADLPHRVEAVLDLHLDLRDLLFEVGFDDPRRQVVALADVGAQDQHPRRPLLGAGGAGEQRPGGVVVAVQRRLFARDRVRRAGRAADPFDVLADAVFEARFGFPAELLESALVGDFLAREVARARRRVFDLAVVGVFLDPLGDFEDRHDLVAGEVVGAAGGLGGERGDDAVGEVLDVDEAAGRAAVAGDRQRLAFEGEVGELGDDTGGAGAGAVGDAEAQHGALEVVELGVAGAVGLAGELGRGVEVARGRDRGFLADVLLGAVAVDPGGRAVDDAADLGTAGGLEHVEGAAGVDLLGEDRVGEDVRDVGDRRQVDHGVAVAHRQVEVGGVGDAAGEGLDLQRRVVRRGAEVEDPRRHPLVEQAIDDVGADEAPSSGDQDPHDGSSLLSAASRLSGR